MAETLMELEQQARALPPHDRARLAEVLLESLQGPPLSDVEAAWNREIEERIAAYDRGDLQAFSAENVFAENDKHISSLRMKERSGGWTKQSLTLLGTRARD